MVFLRWTRHLASSAILLLVFGYAVAQSQPRPNDRNAAEDRAEIAADRNEHQFMVLVEELRAMRADASKANQERAKREEAERLLSRARDDWWFGEHAPVWSNWILALIALGAGWVAYSAFEHERAAVMLTQRADVLVEKLGFNPSVKADMLLSGQMDYYIPRHGDGVVVTFKNFGPTRANNVRWDMSIQVEGQPPIDSEDPSRHAVAVVGAGSRMKVSSGRLDSYYTEETLAAISRGALGLKVRVVVSYQDVFGRKHDTVQGGSYYNGGFVVDDDIAN